MVIRLDEFTLASKNSVGRHPLIFLLVKAEQENSWRKEISHVHELIAVGIKTKVSTTTFAMTLATR